MNTQRPGPLFKHQAQGTRWEVAEPVSPRGTIRLALLIAVGVFALALLGRGFGVN